MPSTFQYTVERHYSPKQHGFVGLRLWLAVDHYKRVGPSYTPSEHPFSTELHGWTELNWRITDMFMLTRDAGNAIVSTTLPLDGREELTDDEKESVVDYLLLQMKGR